MARVPSATDVFFTQFRNARDKTGKAGIILANESQETTVVWYDADVELSLDSYEEYLSYLQKHPEVVQREGIEGIYRVAKHCGVKIKAETLK